MYGFHCGEFFAVVAPEFEVLFVDNVELGGHGFGIGDALGIGAFDEVLDVVGYFGGEFLFHLIVLDGDDGDKGCDEGNFADLFFGEVFVLDFDDTFTSKFAALEVVADEHFVFVFFKAKYTNYLIDITSGDMIYDCSILDGRDHHFFLAFPDCSFFRC